MKILVVEDEPSDLKLATVVLESDGHRVFGTGTPAEVMDSVLAQRPDVILLDLALPGTNGLELSRQLKAHPQAAQIPIIAVTAYPSAFPRAQMMETGCDAYVVKPINTRSFARDIAAVVHEHQHGSQPASQSATSGKDGGMK
jgi:DNA-binding response OmpR family regulator